MPKPNASSCKLHLRASRLKWHNINKKQNAPHWILSPVRLPRFRHSRRYLGAVSACIGCKLFSWSVQIGEFSKIAARQEKINRDNGVEMSKKFKVWLDSGANIHSCFKTEISLDELGIDDLDWESMSDEEKDDVMRDIAFERSGWGYDEIDA